MHEISDNDQVALIERAWHGKGLVVGRHLSFDEALDVARLTWTVTLQPITTTTAAGVVEPVGSHRAVVTSDSEVLGVVGAGYVPHQPGDLVELARLTVDAAGGDARIETVGSLRGRRLVFLTVALDDDVVIGGDRHLPRLVWATSMDGTIATRAVSTMIRAVCANTVRAAWTSGRTHWSARHTSTLSGKAAQVRHALELAYRTRDRYIVEVETLIGREVTDRDAALVFHRLYPDRSDATATVRANAARHRETLAALYKSDDRANRYHGTAWGVVQAVDTYARWETTTRTDRGDRTLTALFAGTATVAERAVTELAHLN